ncbi:MAG: ZIP family metal transporter [Candidatus Aenigmarchaeota archaeon]|jgi:zinc and cadmium transporter|nr:ZIP family metal transporter [Candidatus Aenigmarchaeota archaeon]
MDVLVWIVSALILVSLIGLAGVFSLFIKRKTLEKIVFPLVSFAAGSLVGSALYHLFAEGLERIGTLQAINWFVIGFIVFFILERILRWHHCHNLKCKVHPFSYLIFVGDAIHNIIDGLIIASTFLVDIRLGILTTFLIIAHEVPQELGNFATALYGGMKRNKAIVFTFLSQTTCIIGGFFGYYFLSKETILHLLPFTAGGFIYIATSDLIPKLHRELNIKKSIISFTLFLFGLAFVIGLKFLEVA